MSPVVTALLAAWMAGLAAFVGGLGAHAEGTADTDVKAQCVHGIVAFGGGVLLAAVAFALVPEGVKYLSPLWLAVSFCVGGFLACVLDAYMSRHQGRRAQLVAMLLDFVPEAVALGAVFGHDRKLGLLLAGFIAAQNLPEGFNSYREVRDSGSRPRTVLWALLGVSLLGPLAAGCGYFFLRERHDLTAAIMCVAGGGILYLVFQDIAPQAKMPRHWLPTLGAVFGFALGMMGEVLLG